MQHMAPAMDGRGFTSICNGCTVFSLNNKIVKQHCRLPLNNTEQLLVGLHHITFFEESNAEVI